ncbi:efflux RND transporter permease subunit [Pleionea sp. CnH1-48]|uniref:efflux RND transporter permease subunit n=1 Tax=Pleionea sp. CnH1-48 TaxID=2954494 RepID=UPI0020974919|nr:efflux RND transporter permease subunit [Pleionea sp. CnH1-48]MCO7226193.1 efflux RND transporter permease subunit [Pleionea sp. CnH1-48]
MIRFFASHPTAANLVMILLMIVGIVTLPSLKRETFPEIKAFKAEIRVVYPGATPLDVEQDICLPLEDALDGISFIEEKVCEARQSLGVMTVKMLEKGNFSQFLDDVKSAVDGINDFPSQAEPAVVNELGRTQNVISIALTADIPRVELKSLAEEMKQTMLKDPLIPLVEVTGFSERQLLIQVPNYNLRRYNLSLQQLAGLISKQDLNLPLGSIETDSVDVQLRFNDERKNARELSNLVIMKGSQGNEVRLGDIATIIDTFELAEDKVEFNGRPAAIIKIKKNSINDSLQVLEAVEKVIEKKQAKLPEGVYLELTQDATSIVKDRIQLLVTNAWQGLLLVFAVMWLFFNIRYAFWVVMGLPVSFLASFFVMSLLGITINMISMVALLLALGILMDDAIVIAESIAAQLKKGKNALQAAVEGTSMVLRGVVSSFLTTLCIFIGLVFIEGDLGQILKVIPIVLISVISVSLIEAFLILPSHLYHSLEHAKDKTPHPFRVRFEEKFEQARQRVFSWVENLINFRYAFIGSVVAFFFLSISLMASGVVKFSAFPSIEGDLIQARVLMPAGTPLHKTEAVIEQILKGLDQTKHKYSQQEKEQLIKAVTVSYNQNSDAQESGPHLATVNIDMLTAERRNTRIQDFINDWRANTGVIASAQSITFKEPTIGPSGRAIEVRLYGKDLDQLSAASYDLQRWLSGYPGVSNVNDDLRPGKPELTLTLKQGAYNLGIDADTIANQVRAAFQGLKVVETSVDLETYEVTVMLDPESRDSFEDFDTFPIIASNGTVIPLATVANIEPTRGFSRISRVDNQRSVSVFGDIDSAENNTNEVLADVKKRWIPTMAEKYPSVDYSFEGEIKNAGVTQQSMMRAFLLGIIGVFILLSFQFKSYIEPVIVLAAIPLALVGVIWGHLFMGLDITMPSMLGFVSLAGIVVNDSILLVEFVKRRVSEGLSVHDAAAKASYDRFRAVFLTSVTTIAGMTPLLFETSLQAQVLIPLATSIVFGITTSTLLVLFVIPCLYSILEDFGVARTDTLSEAQTQPA